MDEQSRIKRIQQMQARLDKERALLKKDACAAENKRKYLLGSLVLSSLEHSPQLRRWVLKAIEANPPRDNANQKAILPLLQTLADKEGLQVPVLPEVVKRQKKTAGNGVSHTANGSQ